MGTCRINPTWQHSLCNPYFRFYVNDRTGAAIRGPAGLFHIPANTPVLVPPWGQFSTRCTRSGVEHFHLHFDAIHLRGDWLAAAGNAPILLPRQTELAASAERLGLGSLKNPGTWLEAHALAARALLAALEVLGQDFRDTLNAEETGSTRISPALTAIEDHLAVPLPIPELAKICELSTGAFTRIFTKVTGQSPALFIRTRRIALACELLRRDADIEAVAEATGFANRYHFTRIFTRLCGIAPGAYVRQLGSLEP